jgi:hypothetical protein
VLKLVEGWLVHVHDDTAADHYSRGGDHRRGRAEGAER